MSKVKHPPMIADQELELDNQRYFWSYNPDCTAVDKSWTWRNAGDFLQPPTTVERRLNRLFMEECAPDIISTIRGRLETSPEDRDSESCGFCAILRSMGATDDDLEMLELGWCEQFNNPQLERKRHFLKLPAAAHSPFNCQELRDWYFAGRLGKRNPPERVECLGRGPFEHDDFAGFLSRQNVSVVEQPATATGHVILGREGWNEHEIDVVIERHVGRPLRIYSQEMFLAFLAKGDDPFDGGDNVLEAFKAAHPGLDLVSRGWPGWVSTFVRPDRQHHDSLARGFASDQEIGPLRFMGYRVGRNGEETGARRDILRAAFTGELPIVGPLQYMREWGEPNSPERLRKIADSIATFCRNMKAKRDPSLEAIEDWESDLEWLKDEFYHGHFRFHWPDTYV